MKNMFHVYSTILLLIIAGTISAQYVPIDLDSKIKNSSLIIEGIVSAQRCFTDVDDEIFTENIIEIHRIHKGEIDNEKLAIITRGGKVGDRISTWSHLLNLNTNEYGTFFLVPSSNQHPLNGEFETFRVYSGSQGFYHFLRKENGVHEVDAVLDNYKSVSEFYQAIDARESVGNPFVSPFDLVNEDECLSFKIEPISGSAFVHPSSESLASNTQIWFNIMARVNEGYFKLNKSEILLKYSTEWFYENMASGGYVSFIQGQFDESDYDFQIEDHANDVLKIRTEATTAIYEELEAVEDEWKLLASVGVTLKGISDENPLQQLLDNNNILENNYRTFEGFIEDFECVKLEYGANCEMEIATLTETAAAGVGEMSENGITGIVEITGDNFLDDDFQSSGCIKPVDHFVKFKTVNNGWIAPLEGDYLEFTNTLIRVKVPTIGYNNNSDNLYPGADLNFALACTGNVRVCRKGFLGISCGCFVTSDSEVYIPFAARNTRVLNNSNGCLESAKDVIQNRDGEGGYTWRFDPSFSSLSGAIEAFKRALTTWRCTTRVNFKIDEINLPNEEDGICTVSMQDLTEGTRASTKETVSFSCFGTVIIPDNWEMVFNSNFDWHTGTNEPTLNWSNTAMLPLQADIESTSLHELGHAQLLLHTCNSSNIMTAPSPNGYRRVLSSDDEKGGIHSSLLGSVADNCNPILELIDLSECNITTKLEVQGEFIETQIYPNPSQDIVTVNFDNNNLEWIIELLDTNGRVLKTKNIQKMNNSVQFNIRSHPSGTYYFRVSNSENRSFVIGAVDKI